MKGYIGSNPSEILSNLASSGFRPKVYSEPSYEIDAEFFQERLLQYQIPKIVFKHNGCKMSAHSAHTDTLIMPLRDHTGALFGISTKTFGSTSKKSMHYISREAPMISYTNEHYPDRNKSVIILVEDIISAMKIEYVTGHLTAALLGTTLDEEKIKGILKLGYKDVILWLDLDARNKSIHTKNKYSLFFNSFRNIITQLDPKETEADLIDRTVRNALGD